MKEKIFNFTAPTAEDCSDKHCPFHGGLGVKKEFVTGTVVKKDMHRSATIEWLRPHYIPKYERFEMRRSRIRVHNPACLNANVGQQVVAARTRPLSKTKNHVILAITKKTQ
jgi:small subunit ribosomal protein S17